MCQHHTGAAVGAAATRKWVRCGRSPLLQSHVDTIVQYARFHGFGCLHARAKQPPPGAPPGVATATVLGVEASLCEPLASGGEPKRLASLLRTLSQFVHGEPPETRGEFSTDYDL